MKYCSRNWFTLGSSGCPATDQTLFTRIPTVHLPGCIRATAAGPMPNLPCPRRPVFVAVGRSNCGPRPSHFALLWGKEKCGLHVAEAIHAGLHLHRWPRWLRHINGIGLVDDRSNPTNNEVPVFTQADWNHWLNIQDILGAIGRSNVEVEILLNRNANEAGDRILSFLAQFLLSLAADGRML